MNFLWNVHKYVNDYIRFADTKANIILGFSVALLGVLKATGAAVQLRTPPQTWTLYSWSSFLAVALLVGAVCFAAISVVPRLQNPSGLGYLFWDAIGQHQSGKEFWEGLQGLKGEDLAKELAYHLFVICGIATKKYNWLRLSTASAVGGALAAVAAMILA